MAVARSAISKFDEIKKTHARISRKNDARVCETTADLPAVVYDARMAPKKTSGKKKSSGKKNAPSKSAGGKPGAPKKSAPVRKKPAPLSPEARRSMLKPREGASDLGDDMTVVWKNERGLRVDDLSAAKLGSLVRKARKAEARMTVLSDKHARQMQPVRDAHLSASDALWRGLLDLRAAVGLRARKDPTIEERFAALLDALRNESPAPAAPST